MKHCLLKMKKCQLILFVTGSETHVQTRHKRWVWVKCETEVLNQCSKKKEVKEYDK